MLDNRDEKDGGRTHRSAPTNPFAYSPASTALTS